MKEKTTIDYVLRCTWQAVARMYNEEASQFGSTMATGFALLSLDPEKGVPSTSLGPKMGMEATSLSRILKNMENKGLIYRKPNPADGRGVLIFLSDFGKEKREVSKQAVLHFNETITNEVDKECLNQFYKCCNAIMQLIAEKKVFPKPISTDKL